MPSRIEGHPMINETAAQAVDTLLTLYSVSKTHEILEAMSKPTSPGSDARNLQDAAIKALLRREG